MSQDPNKETSRKRDSVVLCENLAQCYAAKQIDFEVYAFNVTINMVDGFEDQWCDCIDTIRASNHLQYLQYLRHNVEMQDFMPDPRRFLFGFENQAQINKKKKLLRPIYISLVELVKTKLP